MADEQMRRHMRLMGGRGNPYQTLLALFITAVVFMMFQASILKNLQRTQLLLLNSGSEQHNKGKYSLINMKAVAPPEIARSVNPKFASKLIYEIGIKVNGTLLRGVKKDHRKYYIPNKNGTFTCLSGNQTVKWVAVNNDYCDCEDGSDEPGTSACKNGKFYCEPELHFLPSSRVNDGICDCCDGSDEWKGVTAAPDLKLPVADGVELAPCKDTCMDYEHQKLRELNLRREGAAAKVAFLRAGSQHIADGNFGPSGEFYALSLECFHFKSPGYVYEICPYHNVTQNGKDVWIIGKDGKLSGNPDKGYELVMDGGHESHCPEGRPRKSTLTFSCAPENKVKYVSEKSTCMYHVKFDTPAACSDLNSLTPVGR